MPHIEDIDIKSEEVQEILGTPPSWLVRWGSLAAFVGFVILLWLAYWIRYPDVVSGDIRVSSTEPPRRIYSENAGTIDRLLVRNEQLVDSGQALLSFRSGNGANLDDVLSFSTMLAHVSNTDSAILAFEPRRNFLLGADIQNDLLQFIEKKERNSRMSARRSSRSSGSRDLQTRISDLEKVIEANNRQKRRIEDQIETLNNRFAQEQKLYKEGKVSLRKMRETQDELRNLERDRQGIESDSKSKRFEIQRLQNQIRDTRQEAREDSSESLEALRSSFLQMKKGLEDWKKRYIITAPAKGIVAFKSEEIGEQQFVLKEALLMTLVPSEAAETIGRMQLPIDGSGKVDTAQQVIVKFKSYPFYEYGAVIGRVRWKGKVPDNNTISVEIEFPNGLITTRGKKIEPAQEMNGTAEIITSDKRLIEKFFEHFRRIGSS
ncbi:MAG TPA: HlyD family efflux transporter periplasmic adaptor subunit [Saprospiraceae bacterium]|nr:HlyD family efflux transporter periplasmic adaptor subunit [Saprospiraceae bacterium]